MSILMRLVAVGVAANFAMTALSGCSKSKDDEKADRKERRKKKREEKRKAQRAIVDPFVAVADRACKCDDVRCATDASKEFSDLTKEHGDKKVTKESADEIRSATERYAKCVAEATARSAAEATRKAREATK